MPLEQISPELVLVDAELGTRARAALPGPASPAALPRPAGALPRPATLAPREVAPAHHEQRYPVWARITAALWLLVLGILIGGAAIPHAQDKPRVVPKNEDTITTVCKAPSQQPPPPAPGRPLP